MAMGDGVNIGGLSATLTIDDAELQASLKRAEAALQRTKIQVEQLQREFAAGNITAQQLADGLGKLQRMEAALNSEIAATNGLLQRSGGMFSQFFTGLKGVHDGSRNGAMGVLMLSQAIEDAQYGFQAIVNNIPSVVMGLGGSAGLAGAVSLAAIAVNTWIRNWEYATDLVKDTSWVKAGVEGFRSIADAALSAAASVANFSPVSLTTKDVEAVKAQKKADAERKTEAEAATKAAKGIGQEGDTERAAAFKQAVQAFGGGEALLKQAVEAGKRLGGTEQTQRRREEQTRIAFGDALKGDQGAINALGARVPEFGERYRLASPEQKALIQRERDAEHAAIKDAEERRQREAAEADEESRLAEEAFQESLKHVGTQGRARLKAQSQARIREGEEAAPGVGSIAEKLMMQAGAGMMTPGQAQERIQKFLEGSGMEGKRAETVAGEIATEAGKKVERQAIEDALNPERGETPQQERRRQSEVFDAADLASRIQSGVGGAEDVPRKQLDEQKELRKLVSQLVGAGIVSLKPKK